MDFYEHFQAYRTLVPSTQIKYMAIVCLLTNTSVINYEDPYWGPRTVTSRLSTQLEPTQFVRTLWFRVFQIACISL